MELKMVVDLASLSDKELIDLISDASREIGQRLVKALNVIEPISEPAKEKKIKTPKTEGKKQKRDKAITKGQKQELIEHLKAHNEESAKEVQESMQKQGKDYKLSTIYYQMSLIKKNVPDKPKSHKLWKPNPLAKTNNLDL